MIGIGPRPVIKQCIIPIKIPTNASNKAISTF